MPSSLSHAARRRTAWGVSLVAAAYFMENLDGTVIATALPRMALSLHTTAVNLNLGVSAYFLTVAVFIPASGWLADRFGTRTIFACSIAVFTLASLLCGSADTQRMFVVARILQGLGGSMMVPVGRLLVLQSTERRDLLRWIAYITWPGLVAPILGPPLGGWVTQVASWRWIFYLNLPIGLAAFLLTFLWLKNERSAVRVRFDLRSFLLCGFSCSALIVFLEELSAFPMRPKRVLAAAMLSLSGAIVAVWSVWASDEPLFGLQPLRIRTFAVTLLGGSLFRIMISVTPFLLPLMLQLGFGMPPLRSGLFLLALFAGNLGIKPFTTPLLRGLGFKRVLILNGIFVLITTWCCSLLTPAMPAITVLAILVANGVCRSIQFTSLNTLGFADVPKGLTTSANTIQSAAQQLSLGMGAAVGAVALQIAQRWHHTSGNVPTLGEFQTAFLIVSILAVFSVFDFFSLPANAGAIVAQRGP